MFVDPGNIGLASTSRHQRPVLAREIREPPTRIPHLASEAVQLQRSRHDREVRIIRQIEQRPLGRHNARP